MSDLTKQIRLRATDAEKQHLETAMADAGYETLSDYLRHVLFDQNVLIVGDGEHSGFTLVPAYSSIPAEVEKAMKAIQELLAQTSGETPTADLPPTEAPAAAPPEETGAGDIPPTPPVAGAPDVEPAPAPPLQPVPDQPTAPPLQMLGPTPLPEENYEAFLARRTTEIVLGSKGQVTQLRAGLEADAEWRHANNIEEAAVPVQGDPPAAGGQGHGFCGNCGAPLAGTNFCSGCGAPAA